jgi:hypothetical protein
MFREFCLRTLSASSQSIAHSGSQTPFNWQERRTRPKRLPQCQKLCQIRIAGSVYGSIYNPLTKP